MNKDVLIICQSNYQGNTQKIADAMAGKLDCCCINSEEAMKENLSSYKVIGLGSGIYHGQHHPKLFNLVRNINSNQKVFLFSTHGSPFLGKYHNKLKKELVNNHIEIIGEFSCKGYDLMGLYKIVGGVHKGRPNKKDQEKAVRFIAGLLG